MTSPDKKENLHLNPESIMNFNGVLHLFSETGSEGIYLALQDERFIKSADLSASGMEEWSFEGLHILKGGDYLEIYSKNDPDKILWKGFLPRQYQEIFMEKKSELSVIADSLRQDRQKWSEFFINQYKAKLTPNIQL